MVADFNEYWVDISQKIIAKQISSVPNYNGPVRINNAHSFIYNPMNVNIANIIILLMLHCQCQLDR